jgi:hypothetical protein
MRGNSGVADQVFCAAQPGCRAIGVLVPLSAVAAGLRAGVFFLSSRLSRSDGSGGWILGHSSRPWFVTQGVVERSQLQAIASRQMDQVRVRNILAAGNRGKRSSASTVTYKAMPAHPQDRFQRHNCVFEARTEGWTKADSEKPHLADRARRERLRTAEPSVCSHMVGVRLPSTRDEKVHIEQVTHESSSRSALTVSVVIFAAAGAETRTGRPNRPRVSLAPRGDFRFKTNRCPSSVSSTLSPGRRFNALRN